MLNLTVRGKQVGVAHLPDLSDASRDSYAVDGTLVYCIPWDVDESRQDTWDCVCDDVQCLHIETARMVRAMRANAEGTLRWHELSQRVNAKAVAEGLITAEYLAELQATSQPYAIEARLLVDTLELTKADDAYWQAHAVAQEARDEQRLLEQAIATDEYSYVEREGWGW